MISTRKGTTVTTYFFAPFGSEATVSNQGTDPMFGGQITFTQSGSYAVYTVLLGHVQMYRASCSETLAVTVGRGTVQLN